MGQDAVRLCVASWVGVAVLTVWRMRRLGADTRLYAQLIGNASVEPCAGEARWLHA